MKMGLQTGAALLVTLSASTIAGCGGGSTALPPVAVVSPPATTAQLAVVARSGRTQWRVGTPVPLELEVRNTSTQPVTLQFTSSQSFDFAATRAGETEPAWTWSMDKLFTQALRSQTLGAGQSVKFSATWEGATPGRYRIKGTLTANGGVEAAPFEIEIVP